MRLRLAAAAAAFVVLAALLVRPDRPAADVAAEVAGAGDAFVELDGMSVRYRREGRGPPLVLLHGTASSLDTWDGWAARLDDHFEVGRLDLPGFGLTGPDPAGRYRVADTVAFLERFRAALGLGRLRLGGNSLGGQVAYEYALTYPANVEKLVLIDPTGFRSATDPAITGVFRMAQTPGLHLATLLLTPRFVVRATMSEVYADPARIPDAAVDRAYALLLREGNRRAFVDRMNQRSDDRTAELPHLSVPTLLLWGEEDRWIPADPHAERFRDAIPGARLVTFPDAGHVPMEEAPEATAAEALRFLREGA
ncbi:MAG: alpha/beta fold hydrolase [Myxococcota bacterium]